MLCSLQSVAQCRVVTFDQPKMTVFLPSQPSGKALVACPGGGYSGLAKMHEGYDWAPYFNDLGIAYAVLEYRLPGGDKSIPMADVDAAFKILADSAQAWHFDPAKIGVMGSSAGGHLASTMATHPTETCRPAYQVLFYPVISLDMAVTHKGTRRKFLGEEPTDEEVAQWSSDKVVTDATPPAFIAVCADDKTVPVANSLAYFDALSRHGVWSEMHIYPTGGHGWGYRTSFDRHNEMLVQLTKWLQNL